MEPNFVELAASMVEFGKQNCRMQADAGIERFGQIRRGIDQI